MDWRQYICGMYFLQEAVFYYGQKASLSTLRKNLLCRMLFQKHYCSVFQKASESMWKVLWWSSYSAIISSSLISSYKVISQIIYIGLLISVYKSLSRPIWTPKIVMLQYLAASACSPSGGLLISVSCQKKFFCKVIGPAHRVDCTDGKSISADPNPTVDYPKIYCNEQLLVSDQLRVWFVQLILEIVTYPEHTNLRIVFVFACSVPYQIFILRAYI